MNCLILTNGDYGDYRWYRARSETHECRLKICVDGAWHHILGLGVTPDVLLGDMDSISAEGLDLAQKLEVEIMQFPREKDLTDTQIALQLARERGACQVFIWGGTGTRLDHTLSNLYSVIPMAEAGVKVCFQSPKCEIHVTTSQVVLDARPGDTVSLIVLSDKAAGVTLQGFKYLLDDAVLESSKQYAISNVVTAARPVIRVREGVLAVFHYQDLD